MALRSRNGRLLHLRRGVSTQRPMHLTARVEDGVPTLRTGRVLGRFRWLARSISGWLGRRGRVFADRYFSTVERSVRQAWNQLGYVLRNPWKGGYEPGSVQGVDPFLAVDEVLLGTHRFLRTVFGAPGPQLRELIGRLTRERVPFVPLRARMQPCLPGPGSAAGEASPDTAVSPGAGIGSRPGEAVT